MHIVTKDIYFCYGHRLLKHAGRCRHLHGHSVKASISVRADALNEQGMVCDFADIRDSVEKFVDVELDHNMLLHKNDPLIPTLRAQGERYMALDDHPTAEVISRMIYLDLKRRGVPVYEVVLWETASSYASYKEQERHS